MKHFISCSICILLVIALPVFSTGKGENVINQIDIIFDASGSMWGRVNGETKISIAKETLLSMIAELEGRPVYAALRVYGHRNKKCSNTVCEVPMGPVDVAAMKKVVMPLRPKGKTPISLSLLRSVEDFKHDIEGEKIVVLITDGIETCRGNPCTVAQTLQDQGIVTKIHLVGFGIKEDLISSLKCVVQPSGGIMVKADDRDGLRNALADIFKVSITKNFIVSAKDRSGKPVYITAVVSSESTEVARSEGNDVGFFLDPGVYDVMVTNSSTGNSKRITNLAIKEKGIEKRTVFFGNSEITVTGKDTEGNPVSTLVVLYNSETGKIKEISEKNTVHTSALEPGIYDIEVQDLETNDKQWARGIVMAEDTVIKEFVFKRGRLKISTKNTRGLPVKTNVEIYRNGSAEAIKSSPGKIFHEFILPEGTFSVTIRYWYSKAQREIKQLEIVNNQTVEKQVIIDTDQSQ